MSSVVISGDTSGAITLSAPAVSGTTTLTLPATTGSVIGSNSSGDIQFNSGYGSVTTAYGCRAWVNFNGTGTVAIRASGNVTSITDNGTGDYTVNFTTAMPDAKYATSATCIDYSFGSVICIQSVSANYTTSAVRVLTIQKGASAFFDPEIACVSIFR
jgi:hypothetical protein